MEGLGHLSRAELERRLAELKTEVAVIEAELGQRNTQPTTKCGNGLSHAAITRYSRQLLLPELGVRGQVALGAGRVLLVGGGGLGCPAALFLAGCGVGHLGVVDYDEVEISNLHRQVLHSESKVGWRKVESIRAALADLNSLVEVQTFDTTLSSDNAMSIIESFDVILDCSDNVATRYLLNDACVLAGKPLVSGSALRFEGQLTVYNYQASQWPGTTHNGPTYRCLFPEPPPVETVTNCSDGGVLGVVPGLIGTLQALEAMKILAQLGEVCSGRMLLFDGLAGTFRNIKLRPRQTVSDQIQTLIDYEQFCGSQATDKDQPLALLSPEARIEVEALKQSLDQPERDFVLIDVRSQPEMDICRLPGAVNVPMARISHVQQIEQIRNELKSANANRLVVLCRRGNDSQKAVIALKATLAHFPIMAEAPNHSEESSNDQEKQQLQNKEKKHDSGAADLEKVTDYAEEKEIISTSTDLEDAITIIRNRQVAESAEKMARERELAKVTIKKDELELLEEEFEISKSRAERTLREHQGDVVEALAALTN
eukprot:snap_masked-scaffold313_size211302-processed-gene-1.4 protein:Tk07291 transcript:snap_masked-scaffold313_size211302-processed-gene-1.4-mRNA-1 annotation:"adenylyltransferase and sulfurtransferase mocs3-like"